MITHEQIKEIDINKLKKGHIVLVSNRDGNYHTCYITGISIKHKTITCNVGDYATYYNVSLKDCKPYFSETYLTTYLKEIEMITHEYIRERISYFRLNKLRKQLLNDYITQQEKKDKLLELYQELELLNGKYNSCIKGYNDLNESNISEKIRDIRKEIQALEEVLK